MGGLNDLKFSSTSKPLVKDPTVVRRLKLMEKLNEQVIMVNRCIEGNETSNSMVVEEQDSGNGVVSKNRPQWWWKEKSGRYYISFKYGSQTLELSKGKPSIQCESLEEVKKTLQVVYMATEKGELDSLLYAASVNLRKRFNR